MEYTLTTIQAAKAAYRQVIKQMIEEVMEEVEMVAGYGELRMKLDKFLRNNGREPVPIYLNSSG
ncbi:hypothetical protein QN089_15930 (plasmid) [Kurthia sp. YJT4]|uniref:hypothetical protein n=1 Tax=Kurthia sp. YJT4 TaxID=3049086 RepID=UPI00255164CF|nr:hypothetical protein [Kurthia sp. YJT4]WIL40225.1 hypothetical protein QN089_15930 [Kurthia sp. YJT4]